MNYHGCENNPFKKNPNLLKILKLPSPDHLVLGQNPDITDAPPPPMPTWAMGLPSASHKHSSSNAETQTAEIADTSVINSTSKNEFFESIDS